MSTTVYLGGPMRGYDRFNFPEFDRVAALLRAYGFKVVSPAEHDREGGFDERKNSLEGFDMEAALAWDLKAIEDVDGVVFLPGWMASSGCNKEFAHARLHQKPVYALKEWAHQAGFKLEHIGA